MKEFFLVLYLGGHGVIMPDRYSLELCRKAGTDLLLIDGSGEKRMTAAVACVPAPDRVRPLRCDSITGGCEW